MPGQRICKAKRTNGDPCAGWAMQGQLVCYFHGGNAPQNKKAAQRRLAEKEAQKLLVKDLADAPAFTTVGQVYDELLQLAGVAQRWRKILQSKIAELEDLSQWGGEGGRQVQVDVQLFEKALERSAKISESIARLNLEERKAAIDEKVAGMLAGVVTAILSELDLTPEQSARAQLVAPQRLRELAG